MPELPETETIARDLHDMVRGARVTRVNVPRPDVLRETDVAGLDAALRDAAVERVWRRAKLIVLDLRGASGAWHVVVQPRFTGGLIVDDGQLSESERQYVCVSFTLGDGRVLHYRDVRRLGAVALMSGERFAEYSAGLGPEPLDPTLTTAAFSGCIRDSRQPIKAALMDQRRLAGVGNIYANEALWLAGIDPSREAASLSDPEWATLHHELRQVLQASIAARGTSFRDYRDARGERGRFVEQLAAYGRAGEPCRRCGHRLIGTHAVDGRSTVFCARCQY
ncbi:MAG: formamidopyrimidine-DNA glycosylase [Gemmatimonas sp.]|uniref:bifunctional DNA-formamidopyrimidine glycosylase/DNA-(apurinic or apyrimidinic site) lyase n=1 Tax=Gemmatimonas sp. UBA7669 TaxID=1946568 RepID=UPI0025BC53D9|nr:bifunctional DNA-formamidopyrimidine glycosylase/DNA-(apurinic or apyrimidinic site) lyase [Gemmatimonas sp. UBA7669]MBA3918923.1 formamidopyrimidine-DNA glycosylase [Gemmatimonas sp.]